MPKLTDHARRREELGDAAWQVLLRDGVGRVSVRNVAAGADPTVSSLRHVFATQDELLVFALELVLERVRRRVEPLLPVTDRRGVEVVACEFLPLSPERWAEMEVYLSLFMAVGKNPELAPHRDRAPGPALVECLGQFGEPFGFGDHRAPQTHQLRGHHQLQLAACQDEQVTGEIAGGLRPPDLLGDGVDSLNVAAAAAVTCFALTQNKD